METSKQLQDIAEVRLFALAKMANLANLSAGLCHEMNNCLTIISAATYQLGRLSANDPTSLNRGLTVGCKRISESVERLTMISEAIRIYAKKAEEEDLSLTGLDKIVNDTLLWVSPRIRKLEIDLEMKKKAVSTTFESRPTQVSYALLQIFENFFDALADTEHPKITFDCRETPLEIQIILGNNGPKIPDKIKNKIFDLFFTTKDPKKHLGIGLNIAHEILNKLGGNISLDTNEQMTLFTLTLPKRGGSRRETHPLGTET